MSERGRRIVSYDALRLFAIVSVVAIHTLMPYREFLPPSAPVRVFDDLLHYAVPLFVFISGVLAWGRPLPDRPGAFRDFMRRRALTVTVPFAVWTAVYFALLVVREGLPPAGRAIGLLLTGHTWYHLYFIPMLLTFYALTPVASRVVRRSPSALVLGAYAVRIALGPALIAVAGAALGELGAAFVTHVTTHLPHMALGAWFAVEYDRIPVSFRRSWPLLLAIGTAVLAAAALGLHSALPVVARRFVYPAGMAATLLGFALGARQAEPRLEASAEATRMIAVAAPLAFGVYFIHPVLLLPYFRNVPAVQDSLWTSAWFPATVFLTVTAASFAITGFVARVPVARQAVGVAGPRKRDHLREVT